MSTTMETPTFTYKPLYRIEECYDLLGVKHTTVHKLLKAGKLDGRKLHGRTLVTGESLKALIENLPKVGETLAPVPVPKPWEKQPNT